MSKDAAAELAEYVRTRRLRAGMTQEALAERSGMTVDTVGALERGLRKRLYPHTARAIADALGLSVEERAAFAAIAHSPARTPEALAGEPTVDSLEVAVARHNLPASLTRLIGREAELSLIGERLAATRVLTLTGAGGIGKTSLALEAGRALLDRYADGAWLVELAAVTDARLVLPQIASVLGIRDVQGQPLMTTLVAGLQAKQMLLVLDNCEQVLEAAAEVSELFRGCASVAVLATSRSPLRISGEHELLLPPLTAPAGGGEDGFEALAQSPAVRLFVERASAVKANFVLTAENARAVAAICTRLDGLPLALELAAARVKLFAPEVLVARLDRSLGFLTGGANDRPERQRTLRGAIAWSYELLSEAEQRFFRRLGVFAGGFTLSAVEAVCVDAGETADDLLETLAALVDKSLVQANDGFDEAVGEPRFTMFETLREFASEQLAAAVDEALCRRRHLEYFLELMETAERELQETAPITTVLRTRRLLAPEQANLRAALQWAVSEADGDEGLRLAGSMAALWVPAGSLRVARRWMDLSGGSVSEGRRWLEQALAAGPAASGPARAKALYGLGRVCLFQWDDPMAEVREAIRSFEASLALYRELKDRGGIVRCLLELGGAWFDLERTAEATAAFEESLGIARELGAQIAVGWSLVGLGRLAQAAGDFGLAAELLEAAYEAQRSVGNLLGMAGAIDGLGLARQSQRDFPGALKCFEEAVALRREVGAQSGLPVALQRLGILLSVGGDNERAAGYLRESLALSHQMGNPGDVGNGLLTLGALAGISGAFERAARLFGAGEGLLQAHGIVVPADYRALYGRAVINARRALGEEKYDEAFLAGGRMSAHEAVAEALG